jgi:hypothetical protein
MKNITLKQYAALHDTFQYDILLEHLRPRNTFAGRQMDSNAMPWANVKYCIRMLPKVRDWDGICTLFEICYDVKPAIFWKTRITEYFGARKFMLCEFERIIANEAKILAAKNTDEHLWKMAGSDRLKPYGDTLPLLQLGKQLGQYPFDLGRKPYGEIFSLLVQSKAQNEVEEEYRKLQSS